MPILLLTVFLDLVGFSIVFPMYAALLEFYGEVDGGVLSRVSSLLESSFGVGEPARRIALVGGSLAGLYAFVQFLVTPSWGRLSDRIGRRPVLLATTALNAAAWILWVVSSRFEVFVFARVVSAFASGNLSVASAAVADLSTSRERARAMGMLGATIGLGFIAGPLIGLSYGLMPKGHGDPRVLFGLHPFSFPAGIAAAIGVVNFLQVLRRLPETLPAERRGVVSSERTANPLALFSSRLGTGIPRLNAIYFAFMLAYAGFESTLVFLLFDVFGYGPARSGALMAWLGVCSAAIQGGLVRRLVPRFGERVVASVGCALLVPGFIVTAAVPGTGSELLAWTGVTLLAIGVGGLSPSLAALVSLRADPTVQGRVLGAYRSVGALGRAFGPLLAAVLYFGYGAAAPYAVGAAILLVPTALLLVTRDQPSA